jgi:RNA polymerase sigma-70 factor (ECF subfamily)
MDARQPTRRTGFGITPPSDDARQFEELALCHFDLVYRLALKLSHNPHEAEDLVQETFLKAHRAFAGFELRAYGAKPWLLKILHNVYLTRRGQASRAPTLMDDLSLDDFAAELEREPLPSIASGAMDWENFDDELKAAVEALAPDYRSVLLLWALGDLSYKEIADVLGCAIGTVMSRLYRARHQLGETLAQYAADRNISREPREA